MSEHDKNHVLSKKRIVILNHEHENKTILHTLCRLQKLQLAQKMERK